MATPHILSLDTLATQAIPERLGYTPADQVITVMVGDASRVQGLLITSLTDVNDHEERASLIANLQAQLSEFTPEHLTLIAYAHPDTCKPAIDALAAALAEHATVTYVFHHGGTLIDDDAHGQRSAPIDPIADARPANKRAPRAALITATRAFGATTPPEAIEAYIGLVNAATAGTYTADPTTIGQALAAFKTLAGRDATILEMANQDTARALASDPAAPIRADLAALLTNHNHPHDPQHAAARARVLWDMRAHAVHADLASLTDGVLATLAYTSGHHRTARAAISRALATGGVVGPGASLVRLLDAAIEAGLWVCEVGRLGQVVGDGGGVVG